MWSSSELLLYIQSDSYSCKMHHILVFKLCLYKSLTRAQISSVEQKMENTHVDLVWECS